MAWPAWQLLRACRDPCVLLQCSTAWQIVAWHLHNDTKHHMQCKHMQSTVQVTFSCYMPYLTRVVAVMVQEHLGGFAVLCALQCRQHHTKNTHNDA